MKEVAVHLGSPRSIGLPPLSASQDWQWGAAPWRCSSFPRDTPFPGVPASLATPGPIWVLLRDRWGWLSPSHQRQVLSQCPRGGVCVCTCVPMQAHGPISCSQVGTGQCLWHNEPPTASQCHGKPRSRELAPGAECSWSGIRVCRLRTWLWAPLGSSPPPSPAFRLPGGAGQSLPSSCLPLPPELLGSTKKINVNFQDPDG